MNIKKFKTPTKGKLIFSLAIIVVGLIPFLLNPHALTDHIYGGQLFLTDITHKVMLEYFMLLNYLIIIGFSLMIIFYSTRRYIDYQKYLLGIEVNKRNITINFLLVFFISLIYKLIVYRFDTEFSGATEIINNYNTGTIFDVYKLYTLITLIASQIFSNYEFILGFFNLILSSLTIGIFLLLLFKINQSFIFNNFIVFSVLLYMPLLAIDSLLRTDVLYLFLFILSIFLALKLTDTNNKKIIIYFVAIMTLCCLTREQTIYLLPLYLVFIIFSRINNKILVIISVSFAVIATSLFISNYNKSKYGMSSLFKNRILVFSAMQYGYLNPKIMDSYKNELSVEARNLLKDMEKSYNRNILPSKREAFFNPKLPNLWTYIRPDDLNVYDKINPNGLIEKNQFMDIKRDLIRKFNIDQKKMSIAQVRELISKSKYNNNYPRGIANIESIIINDFFYDGTSLNDYKRGASECSDITEKNISPKCLKIVIDGISYDYYRKRHDMTYYIKAAQEVSSSYDQESKKYIRHENINSIGEILLHSPMLYVIQSVLTITTITGYVPIQLGMSSDIIEVYAENVLPDIFLYDFQKLYFFPVNFWYFHCVLLILFTIFFHRNKSTRNIQLFFSLIPIYYGSFLAFATFSEFSRLMLPVIPFIIYNYIQLFRNAPIPMSLVIIFAYFLLKPL